MPYWADPFCPFCRRQPCVYPTYRCVSCARDEATRASTPPTKSGWEWRVRLVNGCEELQRREADDEDGRVWVRVAYLANYDWRRGVPPCDHDYVAALIERECAR